MVCPAIVVCPAIIAPAIDSSGTTTAFLDQEAFHLNTEVLSNLELVNLQIKGLELEQ